MRVNASHHATCRTSHAGRDARVSSRQQHSQFRWHRPQVDLWPAGGRLTGTQNYLGLAKKDKGIVRGYLVKMSGLSRAQITRLIARWSECGVIEPRASRRHRFPRCYTPGDIKLLAETDAAHEGLSAPAVRRILAARIPGLPQGRPQTIGLHLGLPHLQPAAHPNLSRTPRPSHQDPLLGGEHWRAPQARSTRPAWLRCGSTPCTRATAAKRKGLYHINAVDTVTQWQIVGCCETISEAHLLPILEAILHQFPFRIRGFHSDNGSEFLNYKVEKLLNKLLVEEFTKSRVNRTTDNAETSTRGGGRVWRTRMESAHGLLDELENGESRRVDDPGARPQVSFEPGATGLDDNHRRKAAGLCEPCADMV